MDIFTTQLTRVVPVPIKPTSLKVKALLKDAASPKLREDHDHLENHDYYFTKDNDKANDEEKGEQYHASHQETDEQQSSEKHDPLATKSVDEAATKKNTQVNKPKIDSKKTDDKDKHLDLYA